MKIICFIQRTSIFPKITLNFKFDQNLAPSASYFKLFLIRDNLIATGLSDMPTLIFDLQLDNKPQKLAKLAKKSSKYNIWKWITLDTTVLVYLLFPRKTNEPLHAITSDSKSNFQPSHNAVGNRKLEIFQTENS